MNRRAPARVAILGAGLIGIDLLFKIQRSPYLDCQLIAGRDDRARGLRQAASLGYATASNGIHSLVAALRPFDIVFDATNAMSHAEHWAYLQPLGTMVVDLTPSMVGHLVVPTVNGADALTHGNINLITCGGQASIPILHALAQRYLPDYVEVVTTAASPSVGRATRLNLDEYIETTEDALRAFTGAKEVKSMVNLSPARPPATFRMAMSMQAPGLNLESVRTLVAVAAEEVRSFVSGFEVVACTVIGDEAFVAVEVSASGDRIPRYAGNLDIINSAAILVAEQRAVSRGSVMAAGL
jgi:acetaldehyde dehydrogenase